MNLITYLLLTLILLILSYNFETFVCPSQYLKTKPDESYSDLAKTGCKLNNTRYEKLEYKKIQCPGVIMEPNNSIDTIQKSWCRYKQ